MNFERSSLRYAHTTGYTSVLYIKDVGDFFLSCGNDGDLRKWKSIDDDDPTSSCLGEFVICLAQQDDRLLASTDRNTVQAYKFPDIENDGVLMRFTAPVTCICVTKSFVAAGSDDTNIKVQRLGQTEGEAEIILKHDGPVLSLDISPVAAFLASIGGDGQIKIWNLDNGKEIKSYLGLPKTNSFESATCYGTPSFEPCNGKILAYCKDKEIVLLDTSSWEKQCIMVDENVRGNYTCCKFSSDGQFLAAGTTSGEISIFNINRNQAIKCEPPPSDCQSITCVAWKPGNNQELAYCDASGQLGTVFSSKTPAANDTDDFSKEDVQMDFGDIEFDNEAEDGLNDLNDIDDGISIEKLKSSVMRAANTDPNLSGDEDTRDSVTTRKSEPDVVVAKTFKQQSAFQPSSTPGKLEHRYLVWNDVGIVTGHTDDGDGSIDVEFHDASIHHALHIPNVNGHDMASLSNCVLALAATNSSKLVCIALTASGNKEWSFQFPDCESTEAIAATSKIVAVATSNGFLRLFTAFGTQREIISLPGPVVCLAGFEDRIIVCYHSSPSSMAQQYLGAMLIQVRGFNVRTQQISLPLSAGRQLTWLGFSDCGSPVFADSMGLVQLFSLKGNFWSPICDTMQQSQSVSNNYFIISILERQQIIQAVLCRGCTYPMTNPRPLLQELPMHLPLCDNENERTDLEDTLIRSSFMTVDNAISITKETAIKLFALACRGENETRAKELIETIGNVDVLMLSVKYATKLGRIHLSEKLYELLPKLQSENSTEEFTITEPEPISPKKQRPHTPMNGSSLNLAPKTMELSSTKRATLKRFSASGIAKKFGDSRPGTPDLLASSINNLTESEMDSQENLYNTEDIISKNAQTISQQETTRTPLNSVNPFASKRKLESDADTNKGVLGANKLKFAKR